MTILWFCCWGFSAVASEPVRYGHLFLEVDQRGVQGYLELLPGGLSPAEERHFTGTSLEILLNDRAFAKSENFANGRRAYWRWNLQPLPKQEKNAILHLPYAGSLADLSRLVVTVDVRGYRELFILPTPTGKERGASSFSLNLGEFPREGIRIGLRSQKADTGLAKGMFAFFMNVVIAILILVCTTFIQRWFALRTSQQAHLRALQVGVLVAEEKWESREPRRNLVAEARAMRKKPEYGGYHRRFTEPIDELIALGPTAEPAQYRACVARIKTGTLLSWVLFGRTG